MKFSLSDYFLFPGSSILESDRLCDEEKELGNRKETRLTDVRTRGATCRT